MYFLVEFAALYWYNKVGKQKKILLFFLNKQGKSKKDKRNSSNKEEAECLH